METLRKITILTVELADYGEPPQFFVIETFLDKYNLWITSTRLISLAWQSIVKSREHWQ